VPSVRNNRIRDRKMELKLSMIFLLIGTIISLSRLNRENLIN
jgi:glycerol-3-phosphate responsive antiterminator